MFAGISSKADIDIFLSGEEIEKLNSQILEGTIVEIRKPKNQNSLKLMVDKETWVRSNYKIEVEQQGNTYSICMEPEYYEILKENGHVGTRYNGLGDKIDILEQSFAEELDDFRFELRVLRGFIKNREKLR